MGGRRVEVGTRMTRIGWMNTDWFDGQTPDGIWTLMTRIGYDGQTPDDY